MVIGPSSSNEVCFFSSVTSRLPADGVTSTRVSHRRAGRFRSLVSRPVWAGQAPTSAPSCRRECSWHRCQNSWHAQDWITGSYGTSMFNFMRNFQTIFQSGCTVLHTHQQWMRIPIFPHPHWHSLMGFVLAILVGVKWYLAVFSCNTLMTNCVEHLFMGLWVTWISSLKKYLFKSFPHVLLGYLPIYCSVVRVIYIFWIQVIYR